MCDRGTGEARYAFKIQVPLKMDKWVTLTQQMAREIKLLKLIENPRIHAARDHWKETTSTFEII